MQFIKTTPTNPNKGYPAAINSLKHKSLVEIRNLSTKQLRRGKYKVFKAF